MFKVFGLVLLALLVFSSSCYKVGYNGTLNEWTESQRVYSANTFGARIVWDATYLSPEFQATAKAKINEWMKLGPNDVGIYPKYLEPESTGAFLVSIYLPSGYPHINTQGDNFWEFTLDIPTESSYAPESIDNVEVTKRESRLFPYINRWGKFYIVRFPVSPSVRPFSLALRSAAVTSFLDWK